MTVRRPEILAPAGDRASLEAAVRAGADAVYFGLPGFNARARVQNFEAAELADAMPLLHDHGKKGYVTLNTLVFDDELAAVESQVRACAAAGVDAVIVQDLGLLALVRAVAPTLPVHASTQMTCTDAASVELASSLGASRVILARELSLRDIEAIRAASTVELEVFVHGALCISYSGQCLTSEAIGGRSANRGACAQACRLPYELVVDGEKRDLGERAFLLSPEDLEASALVPRLVALGVASLKIEGRLKGPEYVAATTTLYRHAVDAAIGMSDGDAHDTEAERELALQMFTRGSGPGFLAGVDHQRLVEARACDHRGLPLGALRDVTRAGDRVWLDVTLERPVARGDGILVEGGFGGAGEVGGRVWSIRQGDRDVASASVGAARLWLGPDVRAMPTPGRRVFLTNDPAKERAARVLTAERGASGRAVDLMVRGRMGEPFELEARTDDGRVARVFGDAPVAPATGRGLDEALVREKVSFGETPLSLRHVTLELPESCFVPPSALKKARRVLVEELLRPVEHAHAATAITASELTSSASVDLARQAPPPAGLFVLCRTEEQAFAALAAGADGVYLDFLELLGTGKALRALRERLREPRDGSASSDASRPRPLIGVAPPRIRKPEEEKIDQYLSGLEPDMVLVRGLGALHELTARTRGHSKGEGGKAPLAVADFSLNATNTLTATQLLSRGAAAFVPSYDLDAAQLTRWLAGPLGAYAEVVVHHPMPLFHMEHCAIAALLSEGRDHKTCGRPCEKHKVSLRDRAGMDHPVEADVGCRNTVFHARAQSAADIVPPLLAAGVRRYRIELVREGAASVLNLVSTYRRLLDRETDTTEAWRALRSDPATAVVRGSLRVLG
ncbi:MAG: U32 family peptidase [Myxococcales bacterium]|nr:U32 family peptidase [Myxococcales bacterium]